GNGGQESLRAQLLVDLLVDRRRLDGQQVAELGVAVVAHRLVEAHDRAVRLANLDDFLERQGGGRRALLLRGAVAQRGRQLTLHAPHLPRTLRNVNREANRAAGVLQAALDRLTDPQRRIGREAEALAPVELLHGANEAELALLDQVAERQALPPVAPR